LWKSTPWTETPLYPGRARKQEEQEKYASAMATTNDLSKTIYVLRDCYGSLSIGWKAVVIGIPIIVLLCLGEIFSDVKPERPAAPSPAPTPLVSTIAGPMPEVGGLWGVSLFVHDAIKEQLNDPESYKYTSTYVPQPSTYDGQDCWLEIVNFRAKNGFGGYIGGIARVWVKVGPGANHETILHVAMN